MGIETVILPVFVGLVGLITIIGTYWLYVAFASLRGQLRDTKDEQKQLRAELDTVKTSLLFAQQRIQLLERAYREATDREPPHSEAVWAASEPVALARGIATLFTLDEMEGLAFELALQDEVIGDTPAKRARSLVRCAIRHDKLVQLVGLCRRDRPKGGF